MNLLSKVALFATLSTVVCSGFAMDTTPRDVVNATSEATSAAVEFAKENPGTTALLGSAAALATYITVRWFGSSKAKTVTPVVVVEESKVETKKAPVAPRKAGMFTVAAKNK